MKPRPAGFTLMELLIAVSIVGVLSALAVASYRNTVQKGVRTAAQRVLSDVANLQERYYLDARSYTTDLKLLGFASSPFFVDANGSVVAAASTARRYQIAATKGDSTTFVVTATPQLGQASDKAEGTACTLTLDATGARAPAACWAR